METRHRIRPRLDALEGRALLSVLMPESEPNNVPATADVIPIDPNDQTGGVTGRLQGADRDYFRADSVIRGQLVLTARAVGRPTRAQVFDASTGALLWRGRIDGAGTSARFAVNPGTSVLIRLAQMPAPRIAAQYGLNVAFVADLTPIPVPSPVPTAPPAGGLVPIPTAPKPSDTPTNVSSISFDTGGHAAVSGSLAPGEADVFTFTSPRSGRIALAPSGRTSIRMDVLDASGRTLLTVYGDVPNFLSHFTANAGSTYALRVARSPRASAAGVAYQVDLALTASR